MSGNKGVNGGGEQVNMEGQIGSNLRKEGTSRVAHEWALRLYKCFHQRVGHVGRLLQVCSDDLSSGFSHISLLFFVLF